jgi:hypothetical protein
MEIKLLSAKKTPLLKRMKNKQNKQANTKKTHLKKISSKTRLGDGSTGEYYRLCLSLFAYSIFR